MKFRNFVLLVLLGLALSQEVPNDVNGRDNFVVGEGGNYVQGSGNYVNAVDPTTVSTDLRNLAAENTNGFVMGAPQRTAEDRTAALQTLMNAVVNQNYVPQAPATPSTDGAAPVNTPAPIAPTDAVGSIAPITPPADSKVTALPVPATPASVPAPTVTPTAAPVAPSTPPPAPAATPAPKPVPTPTTPPVPAPSAPTSSNVITPTPLSAKKPQPAPASPTPAASTAAPSPAKDKKP